MGARIDSAPVLEDGATMPISPADWQRAAARLVDYLTALGVGEAQDIERLSEQVRVRLDARAAQAPLENAVEAAIEETHALLDEWLVAELGGASDANALAAARAAVLGGGLPGWSARWAGLGGASPVPAIRALQRDAVPEFALLTMEASRIDLCCQRLRRRIAALLCRLFCHPNVPTHPRGERS